MHFLTPPAGCDVIEATAGENGETVFKVTPILFFSIVEGYPVPVNIYGHNPQAEWAVIAADGRLHADFKAYDRDEWMAKVADDRKARFAKAAP